MYFSSFFFLLYFSIQDIGTSPNNGYNNGFHKGPGSNGSSNSGAPPVVKRRQQQNANLENSKTNLKTQYRCSLINLEESVQDEELDAILGELSVLESQFEEEISQKLNENQEIQVEPNSAINKQQPSPVASVTSR